MKTYSSFFVIVSYPIYNEMAHSDSASCKYASNSGLPDPSISTEITKKQPSTDITRDLDRCVFVPPQDYGVLRLRL